MKHDLTSFAKVSGIRFRSYFNLALANYKIFPILKYIYIFTVVFYYLFVFSITVPLSPGLQTHSPTHSPIPYYPSAAGFAEQFQLGTTGFSQSQLQCGSPYL